MPSTFDAKVKKQSLIVSILILIFFIASAFIFLNAFYGFCDQIGSIVSGSIDVMLKDFLRSVPLYLCFFMSFWTLLLLHAIFRSVSPERLHKSMLKDAIVIIAFGGVNILYILIGLIDGTYVSMVEGSPTRFYPLDTFLLSLIFIALGICVLIYLKRFKEKYPILLPKRGEIVTRGRGAYCTFFTFFILIALFGFVMGIYSLFIYDFRHGYAFYGVATILVYLLSPIILGFWEFYYNELIEEKKKEFLLPLALVSLCVSLLFAIIYFVALGTGLDAPSNAGFGMFPVAFAASVNIATLLVVATPIIFSIVALIKGLRARKK